jgi:hypothetical protein
MTKGDRVSRNLTSPAVPPGAWLLQRGGTLAAVTIAVVLGGSGLALGATTHDVLPTPVTHVQAPVAAPVVALPVPQALPAPAPALPRPTKVVAAVKPVVRTVTKTVSNTVKSTVRAITAPDAPVPAPPPAPQQPAVHHTQHVVGSVQHRPAAPRHWRDSRDTVPADNAQDAAFVQRTEPSVQPVVSPTAIGPLAGLPSPLRHNLPTGLVVVAAAILAAVIAGHVGLEKNRREQLRA